MSFVKVMGLCSLVLSAYFAWRLYRRFREERLAELGALAKALGCVRENIRVYHTFRPIPLREELSPLAAIGFRGDTDVSEDLSRVVLRMKLLRSEKESLIESLRTLGEGNLESENEKIDNLIENVKNALQKEEKEGKKSVDTLRIVLFTVVLSLVILFL